MDIRSFSYDCFSTSARRTGVNGESRVVCAIVGGVVIVAIGVSDGRVGFDFCWSVPVDVVG